MFHTYETNYRRGIMEFIEILKTGDSHYPLIVVVAVVLHSLALMFMGLIVLNRGNDSAVFINMTGCIFMTILAIGGYFMAYDSILEGICKIFKFQSQGIVISTLPCYILRSTYEFLFGA
jgi:hypothetical protein